MRPRDNEAGSDAPEGGLGETAPRREPVRYETPAGYGMMRACESPAIPYGTYLSDAPAATRNEPDYRELTANLLVRVRSIIRQIADDRPEIDRLRRETRAILDSLPTFA